MLPLPDTRIRVYKRDGKWLVAWCVGTVPGGRVYESRLHPDFAAAIRHADRLALTWRS